MKILNRRRFIQSTAMASAGLASAASSSNEPDRIFSKIGISAGLEKAAALKAAGVDFLTIPVDQALVPEQDMKHFETVRKTITSSPLPVIACGGFIRPKHLRCVGADANHDDVLQWAEICFSRLQRIGGKIMVFGSGGSRQLKNGWTVNQADEQFITLLTKLGQLAETYGVTVAVEQLRDTECNYINRISHGARLIRAASHPKIRLLADLYHMACMGDKPEDLAASMDVVSHVEIAEKQNRSIPGVAGDDFQAYFRVLRQGGYNGALNIEGQWNIEQVAPAIKDLRRQEAES